MSWTKLTDWSPADVLGWGTNNLTAVFTNYGSGNGVWKYDGTWTKLTDWIPSIIDHE
ncbi:MAG: hypothetical protein KKD92_00270 [Proteobacteria bacterium]|nr:hypothetical protein [Pseudomonadota bacterium]